MRQIKFRGRNRVTDEFVYGTYYYEHFEDTPKEIHAIISEYGEEWRIDPESLAQLVGYDAHGREVYEGDEVVDKFGEKYLAQLTPTLRENHEGAGGVLSKPTERFWTERRQYTPLTLVEQCT